MRLAFRQSPEEFVFAVILLVASAGAIAFCYRQYYSYFYHKQFTRFPPEVAKAMRKALYYSDYNPDPQLALKNYKIALEKCLELGLDPFSNDVMGIKIKLSEWLEKVGNYENAIKVLESLLGDCKRWLDVMEKSVKDGTAPKFVKPRQVKEGESSAATGQEKSEEPPETIWGKRTRVLGKSVGISVKLGELYGNEHVLKYGPAHDHLTWAAETALKELRRRTVEGIKEGEGEWMSSEAIGGTLESLGHSYEKKSQFHLALPLFFQALKLSKDPCHSAVLMNNIAVSFAQHPILPPSSTPFNTMLEQPLVPSSATPTQIRTSYLEAAQRWATNAKQHSTVPAEQRTPECDEACIVANCNLGDIARMMGNVAEARRRFEDALALSNTFDYAPGVAQAEKGLNELSSRS